MNNNNRKFARQKNTEKQKAKIAVKIYNRSKNNGQKIPKILMEIIITLKTTTITEKKERKKRTTIE